MEADGGSGGTGGDARLLNDDCPNPGLNPVGSTRVSIMACFHLVPRLTSLHTTKLTLLQLRIMTKGAKIAIGYPCWL